MVLRRELLFTLVALVVVNLMLAFGSVGLLARMTPAIERIIQENVYSIIAAEDIMQHLALAPHDEIPEETRLAIKKALARAKANVTDKQELPILQQLEQQLENAFTGSVSEKHQALLSVKEFIRINRTAMQNTDDKAKRLGVAGAWGAVLLGLLCFMLASFTADRFRRRVLAPIEEVAHVLGEALTGNRHLRCTNNDSHSAISDVTRSINKLLDERNEERLLHSPTQNEERANLALVALLEESKRPQAITSSEGELLHANQMMLNALAGQRGAQLRELFDSNSEEPEKSEAVEKKPLGSIGFLWTLGEQLVAPSESLNEGA